MDENDQSSEKSHGYQRSGIARVFEEKELKSEKRRKIVKGGLAALAVAAVGGLAYKLIQSIPEKVEYNGPPQIDISAITYANYWDMGGHNVFAFSVNDTIDVALELPKVRADGKPYKTELSDYVGDFGKVISIESTGRTLPVRQSDGRTVINYPIIVPK